jgi:hypothetical protein
VQTFENLAVSGGMHHPAADHGAHVAKWNWQQSRSKLC